MLSYRQAIRRVDVNVSNDQIHVFRLRVWITPFGKDNDDDDYDDGQHCGKCDTCTNVNDTILR
jgi:hypothetical protein